MHIDYHRTRDSQRAYCALAEKELGLKCYTLDETLIATAESYVRIGLLPINIQRDNS